MSADSERSGAHPAPSTDDEEQQPGLAEAKARHEAMKRRLMPFNARIWNCVLRDKLVAKVRDDLQKAGADSAQFDLLVRLLAPDITPSNNAAFRDPEIRNLANWLRGTYPEITDDQIATVLVKGGEAVRKGRGLSSGAPFDVMDAKDRDNLLGRLEALAPLVKWPARTRMLEIIQA